MPFFAHVFRSVVTKVVIVPILTAAAPSDVRFPCRYRILVLQSRQIKSSDELPRVTFRLVNVGFAVIFLASAVLQYNDSDGILWAAVYFAGGCASLFSPVRSATATYGKKHEIASSITLTPLLLGEIYVCRLAEYDAPLGKNVTSFFGTARAGPSVERPIG